MNLEVALPDAQLQKETSSVKYVMLQTESRLHARED